MFSLESSQDCKQRVQNLVDSQYFKHIKGHYKVKVVEARVILTQFFIMQVQSEFPNYAKDKIYNLKVWNS